MKHAADPQEAGQASLPFTQVSVQWDHEEQLPGKVIVWRSELMKPRVPIKATVPAQGGTRKRTPNTPAPVPAPLRLLTGCET